MLTGGCLCGASRYLSPGPVLFAAICHCRDCQRASGSGGVPVMGVEKASFACSGPVRAWRSPGGSGRSAVRNFCGECGSLLFGTPESAPDLVTVYAGSLDEPARFEPSAALFVAQRPHWARLAARLAEHDGLPPDA
ncbi:GFA family protein [Pseudoxanthomonas sp. 10H]|uniref:GFA family protein n=1 Tax=Pseudoxanthomonas sp. 10H TaxID=3242729 RepID=UPI00355759D0